jgi:hypothetical protein
VAFKRENLVFLRFDDNFCLLEVTNRQPSDVELDLEKGVWRYLRQDKKEQFIGEDGYDYDTCEGDFGTVGVYDVTNLKHLSRLANHAVHAAKELQKFLEYEH